MQRSSAIASQFGLTFEWLGAYIATVSEKTREAPESIGRAFSTILARLHSIKANGFNEEDETKVNDVAKALDTVGIKLFDQNGEWREMSTIFEEIAGKWDTMSDKQRAYITTTMAGTIQQNRFLTLMNDMSKGVEGGSRAFELYEKAVNASGVAMEKYSIWEESVTAAQSRMQTAFQELYSVLDADWMKNWYDGITELVSGFADATNAVNGLNIALPVLIGLLVGVGSAIKTAGGISTLLLSLNPVTQGILAAVAGIAALSSIFGIISTLVETTEEKIVSANDAIVSSTENLNQASKLKDLANEYENLDAKAFKTSSDLQKMNEIKSEWTSIASELTGENVEWTNHANAIAQANEEYEKYNRQRANAYKDLAAGEKQETLSAIKSYNPQSLDRPTQLMEETLSEQEAQREEILNGQAGIIADYQAGNNAMISEYTQKITDAYNELNSQDTRSTDQSVIDKAINISEEIQGYKDKIKELEAKNDEIANKIKSQMSEEEKNARVNELDEQIREIKDNMSEMDQANVDNKNAIESNFNEYKTAQESWITFSEQAGAEAAVAFSQSFTLDDYLANNNGDASGLIEYYENIINGILDSGNKVNQIQEDFNVLSSSWGENNAVVSIKEMSEAIDDYNVKIKDAIGSEEEMSISTSEYYNDRLKKLDEMKGMLDNIADSSMVEGFTTGITNTAMSTEQFDEYYASIKAIYDLVERDIPGFEKGSENVINQMNDVARGTVTSGEIKQKVADITGLTDIIDEATESADDAIASVEAYEAAATAAAKAYSDAIEDAKNKEAAKDGYKSTIQGLKDILDNGSIDEFKNAWVGFGEPMQKALVGVYPEIGNFVAQLDSAIDSEEAMSQGANIMAQAIDKINTDKIKSLREDQWGYDTYGGYQFGQTSKESGYANIRATIEKVVSGSGGVEEMQKGLIGLSESAPDVYSGFMGVDDSLNILLKDGVTAEEVFSALATAFDTTGESAKNDAEKIAEINKSIDETISNQGLQDRFKNDELNNYIETMRYLQEQSANGNFFGAWGNLDTTQQEYVLRNYQELIDKLRNGESITLDDIVTDQGVAKVKEMSEAWDKTLEEMENAEAESNNYASQLGALSQEAFTGGAQGAIAYFDTMTQTMQDGILSMYPQLQQLWLSGADGVKIVNEAEAAGLETIKKQAIEKQKQLELDKRLEKSSEQMYVPALEVLKEQFQEAGAMGFEAMWDMLGNDQTEGIISTYGDAFIDWLDAVQSGSIDAEQAVAQLNDMIAQGQKGVSADPYATLTKSFTDMTGNLNTLASAQKEQIENGYLTYDTYDALIKANKEYGDAIEWNGRTLIINNDMAEAMAKERLNNTKELAKEQMTAALQKYASDAAELKIQQSILDGMDATDAAYAEQVQKVKELQDATSVTDEQINGYRAIISEINGMTSAYNGYLNALNTPNQGAKFDAIISTLDQLKEAQKSGTIFTDEVEKAAEYFKGSNLNLSDDPKERKKQLDAMIKEVEKLKIDSEKSASNVAKTFDKLEGISLDGMNFNVDEGTSLNDLADQLGLSPEYVQDMLNKLSEYGYTIPPLDIEPPKINWTGDLNPETSGLIEALTGKTPAQGSRGTGIESLQKFLNLGEGVDLAEDGIFGPKTTEALKAWKENNKELVDLLSGTELDASQMENVKKQYEDLATSFSDLSDATDSIDIDDMPSWDDLLGKLIPQTSESATGEDSKANVSELTIFIETYKQLLEIMSELNMGEIADKMPTADELQQTVSNALSSDSTKGAVDELNSAMNEITSAISSMVQQAEDSNKKLDDTKGKIQSAIEGFFSVYSNLDSNFSGTDQTSALKAAFDQFTGWNPFEAFASGASTASSAVEGISTNVDAVNGKSMGDLGADTVVKKLQTILDKLNSIQNLKIADKTFGVKMNVNFGFGSNAGGSDGSYSGTSFVGEEGRELIYRKKEGRVDLVNGMQLTTLNPGDRVIPNEETERILRRKDITEITGYASGTKALNKTMKKKLNEVEQALKEIESEMSLYDAAQEYHNIREEIDAMMYYIEKNLAVSEKKEEQLAKAMDVVASKLESLEKQQAKYKEGSKKWNKLQKQIDDTKVSLYDYETQLIETRTEQERMNQELEDARNKMRDNQIELENLIEQAIQDREDANERMLQGRISMEEIIMDTLEQNAEREKEIAEETADTRIEQIQKEIDKIDEYLEERRKMSDKEEQQEELAGLEKQLALISADPTRAKERLELEKKIAKLRKDIAWDIAEEEAEAQKKSLQDQIDNIDEYKRTISGTSSDDEDIDRAALIAQMEEILKGTDEEIIEWLKAHNKEYAESTAAAQENTVNGWQDTLDDMNGIIRTHWDEVQSIIEQGQDYILDFLMSNTESYREASRAQAEAYVDEWKKVLDTFDLYNSLNSNPTTPVTGQSTPKIEPIQRIISLDYDYDGDINDLHQYSYKDKDGWWTDGIASTSQADAFNSAKQMALDYWNTIKGTKGKKAIKAINKATIDDPGKYLQGFKNGGLVDYTGLAMVHGSPENPEAFIKSDDRELLRNYLNAMKVFDKIDVPYLNSYGYDPSKNNGSSFNTGDIIVQIDKLETDDDYEEIARRVVNEIYNESMRSNVPSWR